MLLQKLGNTKDVDVLKTINDETETGEDNVGAPDERNAINDKIQR